jgi:hypothetical protein
MRHLLIGSLSVALLALIGSAANWNDFGRPTRTLLSTAELAETRGANDGMGHESADCSGSNTGPSEVSWTACSTSSGSPDCVKCDMGLYDIAGGLTGKYEPSTHSFQCNGRKWVGVCFLGVCTEMALTAAFCDTVHDQYVPQ